MIEPNASEVGHRASDYIESLTDLLRRVVATRAGSGEPVTLDSAVAQAVSLVLAARGANAKVMAIGNGGSAAIASHLQNDLAKAVGVRALVFGDLPLLTARSNDDGYGSVFEGCIAQWAEPGDVLIAVSSSGRSENILRGARAASDRGSTLITMSGFEPDNPLRQMGAINFFAPEKSYGLVELAHSVLAHALTDLATLRQ